MNSKRKKIDFDKVFKVASEVLIYVSVVTGLVCLSAFISGSKYTIILSINLLTTIAGSYAFKVAERTEKSFKDYDL